MSESAGHPDPGLDFSTVLASALHDMKNSLAIVLDDSASLQAQCPPEAATVARRMRTEGQRLNAQMVQLLTLYKLQRKLYTPNVAEWPLVEVLEDVALAQAEAGADLNIAIDCACDENLMGSFDRELVLGLLANVVGNALRYAHSRILLCAKPYEHARGQGVEIQVQDDGPGYPAEFLHDPAAGFQRLDMRAGRTGLGLYFSVLVADLHRRGEVHGQIVCRNRGPRGGGVLHLRLP